MQYRGGDLDLRVENGSEGFALRTALEGETPGAGAGPLGGLPASGDPVAPIRVDEIVLACCNDAFEAAAFHGDSEVRLIHLLHGLARVAPARAILEQRGVAAGVLRRETAIAIASQISERTPKSKIAPHSSAELERVLRQASERAIERHAAASVEDVLRAILAGGRSAPAAALLLAAAAAPDELERWRDTVWLQPSQEALVAQEPPSQALTQAVERLVALDASLREVHGEVAADRRRMSRLIRDIQNELQTLRTEGIGKAAEQPGPEQMQAFEGAIEKRLTGLDQMVSALDARLSSVDQLAPRPEVNLAEIENIMARAVHAFSDRLQQTESALQRLQDESARHWGAASERLVTLEAMVRAQLQSMDDSSRKHEHDLGEVYSSMVKLSGSHEALSSNLEGWQRENGGSTSLVTGRLEQLEETVLGTLDRMHGDMQVLHQQIAAGQAGGFKRWLYGTNAVFASPREENEPAPSRLARALRRLNRDAKS